MATAVDEIPPYYYGYTFEDKTIYEYLMTREVRAGYFVMNKDYTEGDYYPCPRMGGKTTLFQVNTSLMIQYTFATAGLGTLLLHASVTRYEGRGNLFFRGQRHREEHAQPPVARIRPRIGPDERRQSRHPL